ncbi:LOW QUALITY PROTEIN: hypothetical protein CRUP_018683 [Coryphaenoides rupestris]|nr:LOW QUALITY PROTEIN: hypothetical protein CRUP_018683 [Coryphaenoides rupestris]
MEYLNGARVKREERSGEEEGACGWSEDMAREFARGKVSPQNGCRRDGYGSRHDSLIDAASFGAVLPLKSEGPLEVHRVSSVLASLVNQFVKFPTNPEQIKQIKFKFYEMGKMPNTIGTALMSTSKQREWEFVNRKGRHSINVQLVGNADLIITNCVVKWPGLVHDARILRESHISRNLQENPPDGIILGDSAYPLLPWLMTPFAVANNDAGERFNCAHGRTRSTIERTHSEHATSFWPALCYITLLKNARFLTVMSEVIIHSPK